ncbi:MAG: chorismate-binding protein, partial [Acidipropionibacterium acidipropionici]|nr:chorismate-binding protein [Acidipropionibacterium acidipropionici]
ERVEGLDRGQFSGPVGWMTADGSGQWGIGLRCGQFAPGSRRVTVYAGAGIMPSSDPAKEWLETGAKMEAFLAALS